MIVRAGIGEVLFLELHIQWLQKTLTIIKIIPIKINFTLAKI